jgi:hypothetical protein
MISCFFLNLEFYRVAHLRLGGIERLRPVLIIKGDLADFQYYKKKSFDRLQLEYRVKKWLKTIAMPL